MNILNFLVINDKSVNKFEATCLFLKGSFTLMTKIVLLVLPFLGPLSFFLFKDVVNTKLSSNIVYKFMCSCCNANYYGQNESHFL